MLEPPSEPSASNTAQLNPSITEGVSHDPKSRSNVPTLPPRSDPDQNLLSIHSEGVESTVLTPVNAPDMSTNTTPYRPNNPFLPTTPFKTINRILNDVKFTLLSSTSLLSAKPLDYAQQLLDLAKRNNPEALLLNNFLKYAPTVKTVSENGHEQTTFCGLLPQKNGSVGHFRIRFVENAKESVDLHSYHLKPSTRKSSAENLADEAEFFCTNTSNGHTLQVSVFRSEFTSKDLEPLYDETSIKSRYQAALEKYPTANLSPDVVPTLVNCFLTLLKVLRGPLLLSPEDETKTINLNNPSLNSQIDTNLLFDRLGFTTNGEELVPPNLSNEDARDAYVRKTLEIIYLASKLTIEPNEFAQLLFSNNLLAIYGHLREVHQHLSQQFGNNDMDNVMPCLIELSVCSFYKDESIIKCFEETVLSDRANRLRYIDSLKGVVSMRGGRGRLGTYYVNKNFVGYSDLQELIKVFGLGELFTNLSKPDADVLIAAYQLSMNSDPKNYSYFHKHISRIGEAVEIPEIKQYLDREILPINLAEEELNISEITEDEVAVTAYEFKKEELAYPDAIAFLDRAFLSLAVHRKSYILLSYVEHKLPYLLEHVKNVSLVDAYNEFGGPSSSDFEIIVAFQNKIVNGDCLQLRSYLNEISIDRGSKILEAFLQNGRIETLLLPAENWPAGLDNIGNTCYLNSLLQYYFCIKPLRDMILAYEGNEKDLTSKIGGRLVEKDEVERSRQFVFRLAKLFSDMIHTQSRCVQPARELAFLAFLPVSQQVDFKSQSEAFEEVKDDSLEDHKEGGMKNIDSMNDSEEIPGSDFVKDLTTESLALTLIPEVIEISDTEMPDTIAVSSKSPTPEDSDSIEVLAEKSTDFDSSADEIKPAEASHEADPDQCNELNPHESAFKPSNKVSELAINSSLIDSAIEMGRQQDVTECIENVNFQIETALPAISEESDGEQYDLIKKLFFGKTKQTITPASGTPRTSFERFSSLIINVSDHPSSLYDALDSYFSEDLVHLDEGDVKKLLTISELPEVLQFHVQRVLFDRERLIPYKLLEPIPFGEKLYVDRYLDTEDEEILKKRSEVFKWKLEITDLEAKLDELTQTDGQMTIIDTLISAKRYLEQTTLPVKASTIEAVLNQISCLQKELLDVKQEIIGLKHNVTNQFNDYTKVGYLIFAIFIHRGEALYGHYWVYIRDPVRNIFRKYNDETVTEVPFLEVMNFEEGNTATPYYIVYVKDALEKDYIEPLKRVLK